MYPRRSFIVAVALSASTLLSPVLAGPVQKSNLPLPPDASANKAKVVAIFTNAYDAYKQHAFGHDNLSPVSQSFSDPRNGWGATIVDAMTTMAVMGGDIPQNLFVEAVNFSSNIDFSSSKTQDTVSVFETSIRYLGGLLSAYDLSSELLGVKYPQLIAKAKQVADKMAFAWVESNMVPFGHIDFSTNSPAIQNSNIAEAGTLTLEWATLTKYTGNDTYRRLAEDSVRHISQLAAPLPGLPAQGVDPRTGNAVGGYVTWGGGSDSYFEYLIKYPRLTNTDDTLFVEAWLTAVDSSIRFLAQESTVGNHLYLADYTDDKVIRYISSHLACFHGGNWLLGGRLLNNNTIVDYGLQLIDACWNTYASTATGIGPEVFAFASSNGTYTGSSPSSDDLLFYQQHGFYVYGGASDYILRPEVIESNFYAWRVTGDVKYQQRAASMVASIEKFLPATIAYAGITDVRNTASQKVDDMESFFFAELLKYLYLTFDDPERISLDKYVFNTEAHPFVAPAAKASYGPSSPTSTQRKHFTPTRGPLPAVSPNPFLPKGILDIIHGILA